MSARQFANSLSIIRRAEHTNRGAALMRHLYWQGRKLAFPLPVQLSLSRSTIMDDEPGGVISLVNMLGCYDFNNMSFVQLVLSEAGAGTGPGAVFVDVGANIGAYTLIASEIAGTRVVSLEPIPMTYAKLRRNIALNHRDNVVALNLGASKQPGELRMTCDGSSPLNQVVAGEAVGDASTRMVPVDTVDAICARLGLQPSLIKVDVEGHELDVLAGAAAVLPSCAACLVENGDRAGIVEFMRGHGMAGPFHYRHRSGTLGRTPHAVPEDHVFTGPAFAARFPSITVEPA